MITSWMKVDASARAEERTRRSKRSPDSPQSVFQTLDAASLIADSPEIDLPEVTPIKRHVAPNQLLIRCKALNWNFAPNCELLQCTISLHDVSQRIKITEDFHFDFVDEMEQSMLSTMLPDLLGAVGAESKARRALMPLSYRSGSIYLLVRIKAVLKADNEESLEPYVAQSKLKDMQKWIDNSAKSTKLLGRYRQPLAWGAVPVFNDASRLLLHDDTQVKLYRMRPALDDEAFYDTITSTEKVKVAKLLEGHISLSGFLYTPEKYHLQNVIDCNLAKYTKFDQLPAAFALGGARTSVPDLVKEIREFHQPFHQIYPNASFVNNFYVYPLQVELKATKLKAKSIAVRVFLMPSEGNPEKDGLTSIYGVSSNPNFLTSWTTTVDLGEKAPMFFDEIKLALPLNLAETHHLYFQAYSINHKIVNPKKKTDTEVEKLIGVAWMPLFKDNKFVSDATFTLPFQVLPEGASPSHKGYLQTDPSSMASANEDKLTLTFSTRVVSSIYTTNEHLAEFYTGIIKSGDDYMKALDALGRVPETEILSRFAPILNHLFAQLCTSKLADKLKLSEKHKKEVAKKTFLAIVDVASKVSSLTMVGGSLSISEELLMYLSHHFDPGTDAKDNNFQLITTTWVKVLKIATSELKAMGKSANVSSLSPEGKLACASMQELGWFFLHLIVRSFALKVIEKNEVADDSNRKSRSNDKFGSGIMEALLISHELRRVSLAGYDFFNRILARFIVDLYRFMDRGFVSHLVSAHLAELGKESKITTIFRFKFLQALGDFEHYVVLNQPSIHPFDRGNSMRLSFWKSHFIAGHYINEFRILLLSGEEGRLTRSKSFSKFRDLLWKHAIDPRYTTPEWQTRIATMYFPLVDITFENLDNLIGTASGLGVSTATLVNISPEWKDWCYVIFWVLANVSRDQVFKPWRKSLRPVQIVKFSTLLRFCHETFSKALMGGASSAAAGSSAQLLLDEVVLVIVDVVDHFIENDDNLLDSSSYKCFSELASLLVALLRSQTSPVVTCATLGLMRFFCSSLRKPLFRDPKGNFLCSDLCTELLSLCQQQHSQVMSSATSVFFLMIKLNFEEMGEFSRMRRHSTVALSNILKSANPKLDELNRSLEAIASYTDPSVTAQFTAQVKELIQSHRRIIRDCARVEQFSPDFTDLKLDYSYNIANEYKDVPELRVQWLVDMAKLNEKSENWEEAAMCRIQAASLVSQYLTMHPMTANANYLSIATTNSSLSRVAPHILAHEAPIGQTPPITASWFTEDSLMSILLDSCNNLAKAEQYESAADMMTMYVQFCMDVRKYQNAGQNGFLQEWASKADKAIRSQSRIPPNFYRVGFYGKEFGEDNSKEFIYKVPPSQRLADFTEHLVQRYGPQFHVDVLNNKPIAEQTIDPAKHYVQIVNLEPYFETDVNKDITWLDRTRNLRRFYFETAYNPDGGRPSEDVSKMYKRKEVITASFAFPNFFRRVAVEKKEMVHLLPSDCALDLMVMLTNKLKTALNCVPIVAKNLQIILQGAVLAQVNAGPAAIIATFLNNPDDYSPESIEKLKDSVRAFIRACNFGLILNQKLIQDQPDTAALQEAMMSAFQTLQAEAAKHVDI